MKTLKRVALTALIASVGIVAHADVDNPKASYESAVKKRQVSYVCNHNAKVKVEYGFNVQNIPTYAQAYLNGKVRFMPYNRQHSDIAGTLFGDEDSWKLGTDYMELKNYHKLSINIQDPASEITHKNCRVVKVKKL